MTLVIENLSFKYREDLDFLLKNINFNVNPGEMTLIKGDSGIGKSTLFKLMCGVIPNIIGGITQGQVRYKDQSISSMSLVDVSRFLGVVFQDPDTQLFMPTVEDEIAFGLENLGCTSQEISHRIHEIIAENELASLKDKNPKLCSGGEKQLIVFSSVAAMDRPILLLDEAFSQIDAHKCALVRNQLIKLKKQGKGIVLIDHENYYKDLADHTYILEEKILKKVG